MVSKVSGAKGCSIERLGCYLSILGNMKLVERQIKVNSLLKHYPNISSFAVGQQYL